MKQSNGYGTCNSLETFFDDAEKQIAEIMLQLHQSVSQPESLHRSLVTWGAKRMRSAIVSSPHSHSTPSQPSISRTCVDEDERPISKTEKATSPVTPLSFSLRESEDKPKRKFSKKRTKEEWLEINSKLNQQRETLKREIETVKQHYNGLKAMNLKLKAREQELSLCNKEKPNRETNYKWNLAMESTQQHTVKSPEDQQQILSMVHHQRPLINDRTAYKPSEQIQYPCGQMTTCSIGLVGPVGIIDLNKSFEDNFGMNSSSFRPFDMNSALIRAMAAAEARKKRRQTYKEKNSIAAKLRNGYK